MLAVRVCHYIFILLFTVSLCEVSSVMNTNGNNVVNSSRQDLHIYLLKRCIKACERGAENLSFIAGQINNIPAINDQIATLPQVVPFTGFVSSDGLKAMDSWHFDTVSMKLLGERYAQEILKVQAQLNSQ